MCGAPAGSIAAGAATSGIWPSCSASPTGARRTSCSPCTSGSPGSDGRRGRAGAAPRARRPRAGSPRTPGRDDVQGHAAAARDRPGDGRLAAAAAARRAHERARPGRAAGPSATLLERLRGRGRAVLLEHAPAQRGRARLRPRGDHRPRATSSPPARRRSSPGRRRRGRDRRRVVRARRTPPATRPRIVADSSPPASTSSRSASSARRSRTRIWQRWAGEERRVLSSRSSRCGSRCGGGSSRSWSC